MGLDMYVRASKYVSGYSFRGDDERMEYSTLVDLFGVAEYVDPETPSGNVEFTVAYWRKANQIHTWFVENVQGGEDECKPHGVSREQLRELRELCLRVLGTANLVEGTVSNGVIYDSEHPGGRAVFEKDKIVHDPRAAHELLPTQDGFFFGSTDYDEGYVYDLKQTVEQIDRMLKMPDDWSFVYQSSW